MGRQEKRFAFERAEPSSPLSVYLIKYLSPILLFFVCYDSDAFTGCWVTRSQVNCRSMLVTVTLFQLLYVLSLFYGVM